MRSPKLKISDGLRLDLDYVTKTAAILAQRRKGKTYSASVIAEEMIQANLPFVALDPTGAWWGLRASADGKSEGFPVVILGGQHGDVPIQRTDGRFVAEMVVEQPGFYVVDFSLFESNEAERQFSVDFAERLYRRKGQPNSDFPLHLFVDEAEKFVPQNLRGTKSGESSPRLLGAFEALVKRGGLRGLGTTLVSQRAAGVNKNVLEMIDILIVLRTIGPNDRKQIRGYIEAHGSDEEQGEMYKSLASLRLGEAWVWEPGGDPPLFERIQFRQRRTFNSSATPKAGERRITPKKLAPVDIEAIRGRFEEVIAKEKANDPAELKREIAELRKQLKAKSEVSVPKPIEVFPKRDLEALNKIHYEIRNNIAKLDTVLQASTDKLRDLDNGGVELSHLIARFEKGSELRSVKQPQPPVTSRSVEPVTTTIDANGEVTDYMRRLLQALARRHPLEANRTQLSMLSGRRRTSSAFSGSIRDLRKLGLIEVNGPRLKITEAGLETLGEEATRPQSRDETLQMWRNGLSNYERTIFDLLVDSAPGELSRDEIAERTGYSLTSSAFGGSLRELQKVGLIQNTETGFMVNADLLDEAS